MKNSDSSALVLFSGGQDSATCLALALKKYKEVNGRYPDLNGSHSKLNKNTDENCLV